MRGSRRGLLGAGVVVLALVALWAPSFIATRYTNAAVRVDGLGNPVRGWHFLVDAVAASRTAAAGTEGLARGIAERHWSASRIRIRELELVYADRRQVTIPSTPGGLARPIAFRRVGVRARFLWLVHGTIGRRPDQIVGVINMETARVLWDIRRRQSGVQR